MNSSRRFLDPRREEEDNGRFVGFDRRIFSARNDHRPEEESGGSLRVGNFGPIVRLQWPNLEIAKERLSRSLWPMVGHRP